MTCGVTSRLTLTTKDFNFKVSVKKANKGYGLNPGGTCMVTHVANFAAQTDSPLLKELISRCLQVRDQAYCPYSRFPVGAAILTAEGAIITGCNVENASYGLTMCAERTAVQKAVTEGHRHFSAIAVACDIKDEFVGPCGACRQVLMEFGSHWDVYLIKPDGSYQKTTLQELLPRAFTPAHLKD